MDLVFINKGSYLCVCIMYQGPLQPTMNVYMVPLGTGMSLSCTDFVKNVWPCYVRLIKFSGGTSINFQALLLSDE